MKNGRPPVLIAGSSGISGKYLPFLSADVCDKGDSGEVNCKSKVDTDEGIGDENEESFSSFSE